MIFVLKNNALKLRFKYSVKRYKKALLKNAVAQSNYRLNTSLSEFLFSWNFSSFPSTLLLLALLGVALNTYPW